MNRKLILNLVLPVTIIIFILFSKWWIVNVVDGTDGIMYGFPFIYKAPAFYTSMAEEFFILELIADLIFYFGVIFGIVYLMNKFLFAISIRKVVSVILFITASLLISLELFFAFMPENKFSLKRDDEIEIKQTGLKFLFNNSDEIEFDKHHK
ncbi:hypothetical protein DMB65_20775 [Flavobacterium cheongpyeongense]|uniref:DUF3810 domain-containing protein n=1 Tax=Flavobacterium cheongpyeongense TaxID=2212651 RepID=A0A2V4BIV8_9FLAO|nr:hypothetical protein [Flavobacterium cheongpyeongense]PXY38896.1 hypothetical protein DMB65_20775 [Flavobacterium cheongpyeongense]